MYRSSILGLCIALCSLAPTRAAIITVTSDSGGTGGPDCTLRDAITAANTDTATGTCPAGSGADTIELPENVTIMLAEVDNGPPTNENGLPQIASVVAINGHGTTVHRDTAEATPDFRVFDVAEAGDLTLNDLSIIGGYSSAGGGVRNKGILTVTNSTVSENFAQFVGGGIYNQGTVTLDNSTICDNIADLDGPVPSHGGGIQNFGGGLTLTNCTIDGNHASYAGGIGNDSTTPSTVTNCSISGNTAAIAGGGISNSLISTLTMTDCTVSNNTAAADDAGGVGNGGTLTMTNCTADGNIAADDGGGIWNGGTLTMTNSTANGNTAYGDGGGMWNNDIARLTNSVLSGNSANSSGGGIRNFNGGELTMTNSTVSNNTAILDGGGGIYTLFGGATTVTNGILWGNVPNQISGKAAVSYSDIRSGWEGVGNIETNPLFVDPANGNYRLSTSSPCIDAADNAALPADEADLDDDGNTDEPTPVDLDGNERSRNDLDTQDTGLSQGGCPIVDMGAYEFQVGTTECCPPDLDGSGAVEAFDLAFLLGAWGPCPEPCEPGDPVTTCAADLDGDCQVGASDLAQLLGSWGPCPS